MRPPDHPALNRKWTTFVVMEKEGRNEYGGIYVYVHPGWAYFDLVWVEPKHRSQGLGRKLMEKAEIEAQKRGCHSAWLWTQDFEAPGFYEKLGYKKFVVFEDFIPGHQRIGYMKRLA